MKRIVLLIFLVLAAYVYLQQANTADAPATESVAADAQQIKAAFDNQRSDVQVRGTGEVTRLLSDDNEGSRHQRFIVTLPTGQTVLIAHNIDLAQRIDALRQGDQVSFYGEYEWNPQGGVVHWTHHDPAGRHPGGWIDHNGQRYE